MLNIFSYITKVWGPLFAESPRWQEAVAQAKAGTDGHIYVGIPVDADVNRGLEQFIRMIHQDSCSRLKLDDPDLHERDRAWIRDGLLKGLPQDATVCVGREAAAADSGGFLVFEAATAQLVDVVTAPPALRSLLEGSARLTTRTEAYDHYGIGANAREMLGFLKGLWLLVGPGRSSKREGVVYADFSARCTGPDALAATFYGSESAALGFRDRLVANLRQRTRLDDEIGHLEALKAVEIDDDFIAKFGTEYHGKHTHG